MKNNDRRKAIGKNLQRIRKDAGYKSAASFANVLGVKTGTYTSWEQGESIFSYEQAWEIADALHCTLDELGGRQFDARRYSDLRQERMNLAYESLADSEKGTIAGVVESYARDTARRIEKNGAEDPVGAPSTA